MFNYIQFSKCMQYWKKNYEKPLLAYNDLYNYEDALLSAQ